MAVARREFEANVSPGGARRRPRRRRGSARRGVRGGRCSGTVPWGWERCAAAGWSASGRCRRGRCAWARGSRIRSVGRRRFGPAWEPYVRAFREEAGSMEVPPPPPEERFHLSFNATGAPAQGEHAKHRRSHAGGRAYHRGRGAAELGPEGVKATALPDPPPQLACRSWQVPPSAPRTPQSGTQRCLPSFALPADTSADPRVLYFFRPGEAQGLRVTVPPPSVGGRARGVWPRSAHDTCPRATLASEPLRARFTAEGGPSTAWRGRPGESAHRARRSLIRARLVLSRGHVSRASRGQIARTPPRRDTRRRRPTAPPHRWG